MMMMSEDERAPEREDAAAAFSNVEQKEVKEGS